MPKLPVVSGFQLVKVLTKICYQVTNKRGDHVTLAPKIQNPDRTCPLIVVMHKEIKPGTLMTTLARASLSKEEFINLLSSREESHKYVTTCR